MSAPYDFYQDALSSLIEEAEIADELRLANRNKYRQEDPKKRAERIAKMKEAYWRDPEKHRAEARERERKRYWSDPEKARQKQRETYARRKAAKAQKEGLTHEHPQV